MIEHDDWTSTPTPPPEPAKPQHVAVEVGSVWKNNYTGHNATVVRLGLTWGGDNEPAALLVVEGPNGGERTWPLYLMPERWTLVARAPVAIPAAPKVENERARCGEWCGKPYGAKRVPSRFDLPMFMAGHDGTDLTPDAEPVWCTATCRDRRYPPLSAPKAIEAAKPVTVEQAKPKCGNNGCKTPYQNVAQRWCTRLNEYAKAGADLEWSCEPCHLLDEAEFTQGMSFETSGKSGVLSDTKRPALIDRRLSHSFGVEDPAL